jgi:hypothetical protein
MLPSRPELPAASRRAQSILCVALVLIAAVVAWKRSQPVPRANGSSARGTTERLNCPLPHLALFDQRNQLVRLDRYRGRHELLIQTGAGKPRQDKAWRALDGVAARLESAGWIVLRMNSCRPAENRPEAGSTDSAGTLWLSDLEGRVQAELAAAVDAPSPVMGQGDQEFQAGRWYHVDRRGVIVRWAPGWVDLSLAEEFLASH